MRLKTILFSCVSLIAAYGTVLAIPVSIDFMFDTSIQLIVITWINIGVTVMRLKKMPFPLPASDRVDLQGGLRLLWWALFWPSYLGGGKR